MTTKHLTDDDLHNIEANYRAAGKSEGENTALQT
jgi:hypothetical protein